MSTIFDPPGTNPHNPFVAPIQAIISTVTSSQTASETAVADLTTTITNSRNPATALWQFWDAFFISVATSRAPSHTPHLALLSALRAQPSTLPTNVPPDSDEKLSLGSYTAPSSGRLEWSDLPRFGAQWGDTHDILEAWRDWDGVRASGGPGLPHGDSPDVYFLRFCEFSAALVEETKGRGGVHPINEFYACRNVLERETPRFPAGEVGEGHKLPAKKVWALDVRVAAAWVRGGGRALWEMNGEELRKHWADTLDFKTDLWPREDGLTRERWELWGERLRSLAADAEGELDGETRAVAVEAAKVVEGLLAGSSS